jgi:tyrosine-protein phosphatase YwqE
MFNRLIKRFTDTKPVPINADWSFLVVDMHSHLIPGIDDGASSMTDSLTMIKELKEMGFQKIITTPHIKHDHYKNNQEIILSGLDDVRRELKANNIDIEINAAAEYYVDDIFMDMLESNQLLTIHNNEVLIEFSFMFEPVNLMKTIFRIQTKGYRPIIAHPERYLYFHQRPETYNDLKDRGCLLQLNTLSLFGYYGKREQQMAEELLEENLYDYCGTDMHHAKHSEIIRLSGGYKAYHQLKAYSFRNPYLVK